MAELIQVTELCKYSETGTDCEVTSLSLQVIYSGALEYPM